MLLFLHSASSMNEYFCDIINTDFVREINVSSVKDGDLLVQVIYIHQTKVEEDNERDEWKEYYIRKKEDKFYFLEQLKNLGLR